MEDHREELYTSTTCYYYYYSFIKILPCITASVVTLGSLGVRHVHPFSSMF